MTSSRQAISKRAAKGKNALERLLSDISAEALTRMLECDEDSAFLFEGVDLPEAPTEVGGGLGSLPDNLDDLDLLAFDFPLFD